MSIPSFPTSSPTARPLKLLLGAIFALAIAGPALEKFGFPVQYFFGLSLLGLSKGFIWTLATYPFVYPVAGTLDLMFHLGFDLVLLWAFGSPLIDRIGSKRFFVLFFGSAIFAGLSATLGQFLFGRPYFGGPSPSLIALYTAWAILHAGEPADAPLFRPVWIFWLLVVGNLFLDLLARQWVALFADAAGAVFGYFFCIISEKVRSPISFLMPMEKSVLRAVEKLHAKKQNPPHPKVIDFATGEPVLDDEQFMDAMLARISLYGEETLTPDEKKRMQKISERKASKR